MEQSRITVKYIGKWDSMVCDYNGKRYCFRSRERISTIPTAVYDFIKQAKDTLSTEIIPHQQSTEEFITDEEEDINEEFSPKKAPKKLKRRKENGSSKTIN